MGHSINSSRIQHFRSHNVRKVEETQIMIFISSTNFGMTPGPGPLLDIVTLFWHLNNLSELHLFIKKLSKKKVKKKTFCI